MTTTLIVRPAAPADLDTLNEIALAAKAVWGYAPEVLESWRDELTVSLASLTARPTPVAVADDRIVGFGQLDPGCEPWDLAALWVAPGYMRRGVGRRLLRSLLTVARAAGQRVVRIDADPNAVAFYLACGARVVGQLSAPIPGEPGRLRPQLELTTGAGAGSAR